LGGCKGFGKYFVHPSAPQRAGITRDPRHHSRLCQVLYSSPALHALLASRGVPVGTRDTRGPLTQGARGQSLGDRRSCRRSAHPLTGAGPGERGTARAAAASCQHGSTRLLLPACCQAPTPAVERLAPPPPLHTLMLRAPGAEQGWSHVPEYVPPWALLLGLISVGTQRAGSLWRHPDSSLF